MQAAFGDAGILGHRAVDAVTESEAVGIEIIEAGFDEGRVFGEDCGGFADDAVTFFEGFDARTGFGDDAAEFVAEDDGIIDLPALRAVVLVQIAAADADRLYGHEDIAFAEFRFGDVAQFDGVRCG